MSKYNKIILSTLLGLSSISSFAQQNGDIKVNAEVISGCFLEADNINFGILMMPIQNQSSSSNMRVHCSKNAPLTINIEYSGNHSGNNSFSTKIVSDHQYSQTVQILTNGSSYSGTSYDIQCDTSQVGKVYFSNQKAAELFGTNFLGYSVRQPDIWGICNSKNINTSVIENLGFKTSGVLSGIASGENIIFSVEKPNEPSIVWNSKVGYELIANGQTQTIPMKANIKKADNPTHRMTPDTYQSNLTVLLNY